MQRLCLYENHSMMGDMNTLVFDSDAVEAFVVLLAAVAAVGSRY